MFRALNFVVRVTSSSSYCLRPRTFAVMTQDSSKLKIGTHNGPFHCDEVLAVAMLKLLPEHEKASVVRTRDEALLAECDIVVDVGGVFDDGKKRLRWAK